MQRLTRRVGGVGTHAAATSAHSTQGREYRNDDGETECSQSVNDTLGDGSYRMDKRNQVSSSSSKITKSEHELRESFIRKLDTLRQRWQAEKSKELDTVAAALKKKHDSEMDAVLKSKEKELKILKMQLQKTKEQLLRRPIMNSASQDSIKSSRSQDHSHSRGRTTAEMANRREQLSELQQTVKRHESELKRKETEIRTMREQHDSEVQRMARDAQRHIKALLEEPQQKERKIEKLQRQLRTSDNQISTLKDENSTLRRTRHRQDKSSTSGERQYQASLIETPTTQQVVDMKLAHNQSTSSVSSQRLGLVPPNMISKDEYEKDKQRWQQRMGELETALKKSEESNAELVQSKAEMIKRNKELEKVKKSLEEFNKRLSDRQKILNQETKALEQKLKEAQDETIRTTHAHETVTLECNRLKEKRYNPDRDEELEKLRQQNLEYCKCISALKQTILEKDRRLEVLQQKLRRSKRCRTSGAERSDDENARSINDLDFTSSSMSLDTINEDYGEATKEELEANYRQLAHEHLELQNVYSTVMRQASTDHSLDDNQELRNRLQDAMHRIVQLEKSSACSAATGVDSAWAQEKLKYASLIRAMGEKIQHLELAQERLEQELGTAREENELLEFQVLEMEHSHSEDISLSSSSLGTSRYAKSLCDRSVSTSEDEGHVSMDHSLEEHLAKELPLEELKIRFTLLKHRKELRTDDRCVVTRVKDMWESLQNEHLQCGSKLIECEMRIRETEAQLRAQIESLQAEKVELSSKDQKKVKTKELQRDLDKLQETFAKMKEENTSLKGELSSLRTQIAQLQAAYAVCSASEKRERIAAETLRKQLDDLAISRPAEIEILEQASRQQAQSLAAMRTKIADLEKEIDSLTQENRSLSAELSNVGSSHNEELERLRKLNSEYQESFSEFKKLEICWTAQKQGIERKYSDVKLKFKEAMKLIKDYELSISKYVDRLKEAGKEKEDSIRIRAMQEQRIAELERELELLKKSGHPSEDDFLAYKEVEDQLKSMLQEKSNQLENKSIAERRLMDEKAKLQKQLQHVKSYSAQLESQFEMQIQIAQALKNQVLEFQMDARTKDEKLAQLEFADGASLKRHLGFSHRLITLLFPTLKAERSADKLLCCKMAAETTHQGLLDQLERLGSDIWNSVSMAADSKLSHDFDTHKACVKLQTVKNALSKVRDGAAAEPMTKLCSAMLHYCERLSDSQSKVDELEKSALMCKETDKANTRAEMLQKQCHDALVQQMGTLTSSSTRIAATNPGKRDIESEISTLDKNTPEVLERIYQELKGAIDTAPGEHTKVLASFRSRLMQLLIGDSANGDNENCLRTVSPSELCGSGTESELCEKSPRLSRKRRPAEGASGSCRSSSSDDSDTKKMAAFERKTRHSEDGTNLAQPTNVRLAADLRNGRYLVCWSPPEVIGCIQGYRIYVRDAMRKQIASAHCTKAVIECGPENDWMSIDVRSVASGSESGAAVVDVERSKKVVQSAVSQTVYESSSTKMNGRRKCTDHDNEDDEECSDV